MADTTKITLLESVIFGILFGGTVDLILGITTDQLSTGVSAGLGLGVSTIIIMSSLRYEPLDISDNPFLFPPVWHE